MFQGSLLWQRCGPFCVMTCDVMYYNYVAYYDVMWCLRGLCDGGVTHSVWRHDVSEVVVMEVWPSLWCDVLWCDISGVFVMVVTHSVMWCTMMWCFRVLCDGSDPLCDVMYYDVYYDVMFQGSLWWQQMVTHSVWPILCDVMYYDVMWCFRGLCDGNRACDLLCVMWCTMIIWCYVMFQGSLWWQQSMWPVLCDVMYYDHMMLCDVSGVFVMATEHVTCSVWCDVLWYYVMFQGAMWW